MQCDKTSYRLIARNRYILTTVVLYGIFLGCGKSEKSGFDRIIFHTTNCFLGCPTYHLELNKNKKVWLFAEYVSKHNPYMTKDTAKMGYFTGFASDTTFIKLSNIIKTIGLDTVKYTPIACCDGSVTTIILYRNEKRTYIHSMVLPDKLNPLTGILYEICEKSAIKRTNKKFKIEDTPNFAEHVTVPSKTN